MRRETAPGSPGAGGSPAAGPGAGVLEQAPVVGLVVATEVEARLFLNRYFRTAEAWEAAGRRWFVGRVDPADDRGSADRVISAGDAGRADHRLPQGSPLRAVLVISGYDKANAAVATALLLERFAPSLLVNFGIAGAFPGSGLALCDVVLATADSYADTGSSSPQGWLPTEEFGMPLAEVSGKRYWNTFSLEASLVEGAAAALRREGWARRVRTGPCVTLSQVTGTAEEARVLQARWGALAESMEGAACAHMCAVYGARFLEVRGISNPVGDRERRRWDVRGAALWAAYSLPCSAAARPGMLQGAALKLCSPSPAPTIPSSSCLDKGHGAGAPAWKRACWTSTVERPGLCRIPDVQKLSLAAFARERERFALLPPSDPWGRGCWPAGVARGELSAPGR